MVRFVHTSDWQLGMTRYFLEGEAQARYTGARIDAIRSIGAVARDEGCEFVVVAGDVFDSNLVGAQTVRRALEAMAAVELPVYLLPGNHDPLDAVTIYRSRLFERHRPENVHVLDTPGVVPVRAGVEIVAAPWFGKAPLGDAVQTVLGELAPVEAGDPGACGASGGSGDSLVRVLVGHGALDVLTPDREHPGGIALRPLQEALESGVVHYAALGDKHTRLAVGRHGLVHYSGSPEVTSFREDLPGDVLVVDLLPGRPAVVSPRHVGTWRFLGLERHVAGDRDLDDLDETLGELEHKERTVVRTGLQGTLTLRQKARLDTLLDAYGEVLAACVPWVERQDLAVIMAEEELTDIGIGGFVDQAVADLAGMAAGRRDRATSTGPAPDGGRRAPGDPDDGGAEVAREALSLLYRLAKGPAA